MASLCFNNSIKTTKIEIITTIIAINGLLTDITQSQNLVV
jgi:hypothetical protein